MLLIETKNLYKDYVINGGFTEKVLKKINIKINKGEFVSIVGPSGSGKSTLMNIMGCLDKPTSGSCYFDNQNIANLEKNQLAKIRNAKIGFVFQGFNLLYRRNIADNVSMPLVYCNVCYSERFKRAKKMLEAVGLMNVEKLLPNQLSGGMQQRVALARALVNNPDVIFADEPTGNLDTKTSEKMMEIFKKLNKEKKVTVVMVTHNLKIALYSNRIISIKDGMKEFDGSIKEAKMRGFL